MRPQCVCMRAKGAETFIALGEQTAWRDGENIPAVSYVWTEVVFPRHYVTVFHHHSVAEANRAMKNRNFCRSLFIVRYSWSSEPWAWSAKIPDETVERCLILCDLESFLDWDVRGSAVGSCLVRWEMSGVRWDVWSEVRCLIGDVWRRYMRCLVRRESETSANILRGNVHCYLILCVAKLFVASSIQ